MKNKTWVKTVKLNNRTFELVFYRDEMKFLWCQAYEIYRPKKNFFDIFYKGEIFKFWTEDEDAIVKMALKEIDKIFEQEEKMKNAEKALDKFADYIV
jgi:hypothetical protein